jgi:hypothetical protein
VYISELPPMLFKIRIETVLNISVDFWGTTRSRSILILRAYLTPSLSEFNIVYFRDVITINNLFKFDYSFLNGALQHGAGTAPEAEKPLLARAAGQLDPGFFRGIHEG